MWLNGFHRQGGRLVAEIIDFNFQSQNIEPRLAHKIRMPINGPLTVAIVTNTSTWSKCEPTAYLWASGYQHLNETRHDIFSFKCGATTFLVPALLFTQALIPNPTAAFGSLYRPTGLTEICLPVKGEHAYDVQLVSSGVRRDARPQVPMLYRWLSFFPSAKRCWGSVLQSAANGVCSI
ncbi:hypothetical protein BHUM_05269 [Candidatus Burkholderia humilis]|nr:hypothetical protein BHUM_05269 [Candidatus Burkholderia humilis]